ncbi:hypothetical protein HPP92_019789 [Vanilla planifolia]|uniref:Uncharacterized protein n=1 Tax=Vanilla planifolia TaxID=51239 RepID=A0A835UK60_VANPL|nr:hypothetical protein HPP92_019789 [Vanilla planifolia]
MARRSREVEMELLQLLLLQWVGKLSCWLCDAWEFLVKEEEVEVEEEDDEEALLPFLQPPPTGTLRRDPPLVQYVLQPLQKYLGWERL